MCICAYNNKMIYSIKVDDCSYISIPISLLFFASACLLAVEIRLSISELVMPDTVA